jgi:hypothetical protein
MFWARDGHSRERRGIDVSEDLARGRRKKCQRARKEGYLHVLTAYTYLTVHHTALYVTVNLVTGSVCWLV